MSCSFLAVGLIHATRNYVSELSLQMWCKGNQGNLQMLHWSFHHIAILLLDWLYSFPEVAWAKHDIISKHVSNSSSVSETSPILNHGFRSWNRFFPYSMTYCLKNNLPVYCYTNLQTCYYYYQNSIAKFLQNSCAIVTEIGNNIREAHCRDLKVMLKSNFICFL